MEQNLNLFTMEMLLSFCSIILCATHNKSLTTHHYSVVTMFVPQLLQSITILTSVVTDLHLLTASSDSIFSRLHQILIMLAIHSTSQCNYHLHWGLLYVEETALTEPCGYTQASS